MNVTFYTNSADSKVVDKSSYLVSNGTLVSAALAPTDGVTVENPTFIVNYDPAYIDYNYLFCDTFKRYYYITDKVVEPGKKIELICNVDPLMSFKNQFLNSTACVTRSESVGGPTMVPDDRLPINPNKKEFLSAISRFTEDSSKYKYYYVSLKFANVTTVE